MVPDQHGAFQGVYIIAPDAAGPCKVGISCDIATRIKSIQVGCWVQLFVYSLSYVFRPIPGVAGAAKSFVELSDCAAMVEAGAGRVFGECDVMLHGEWADVSVDDARAVIEKVADSLGLAHCHCGPEEPFSSAMLNDDATSVGKAFVEEAWTRAQDAINSASRLMKRRA